LAKIDEELLDQIAIKEVEILLENCDDPEMRRNPSFLEKLRKFLKENKLQTTPETPGVNKVQQKAEEIPDFDKDEDAQEFTQ
jgi:hypothetical protein